MSIISLMIVDNDPSRVQTLSSALAKSDDFKLLSAVSKRETAMKQLSLAPSILLLNSGILKQRTLSRFIRSVQAKSPKTRVVLLFEEVPDDDSLISDIRLGVRGYIKVTDSSPLIAKAVRAVHAGEIWAERRVLEKTIAKHTLLPESLRDHIPDLQPLTSREMDMLNMVLKGATNREIAEASNISERTVKTHLYRVYRKLKVKSRTKAIALLSNS